MIFALAAAATMSLLDVDTKFLLTYLPRSDYAAMDLLVSPDGVVLECNLVAPKLESEPAAKLCAKAIGVRAIAEPPIGPDGNTTHGFVTAAIFRRPSSQTGPTNLPAPHFAIEFEVNRLPNGAETVRHNVTGYVDEAGILTHCQKATRPGTAPVDSPACRLATGMSLGSKRGSDGIAVGYMISFPVIFMTKAKQP